MKRSELLAALATRICAVRRPHPVRVAVDGVDASGKTTLANELAEMLQAAGSTVIRASIDGFHNPAQVRRQRNDAAKGYFEDSFDYPTLIRELLTPLGPAARGATAPSCSTTGPIRQSVG